MEKILKSLHLSCTTNTPIFQYNTYVMSAQHSLPEALSSRHWSNLIRRIPDGSPLVSRGLEEEEEEEVAAAPVEDPVLAVREEEGVGPMILLR